MREEKESEEDEEEVGRFEVSAPEDVSSWGGLENSAGAVTIVAEISVALVEPGVESGLWSTVLMLRDFFKLGGFSRLSVLSRVGWRYELGWKPAVLFCDNGRFLTLSFPLMLL